MKERSGAPEGEETGVRERLHGRPRKSFQLAFRECGCFQLVERLPREKVTALGEKTGNQKYMDNVVKILYHTISS